jgi:hypothetical protein
MSARQLVGSERDVALIDLLDRLLAGGVVLSGDITLSVADVDLVHVGLRAIISSVSTQQEADPAPAPARGMVSA